MNRPPVESDKPDGFSGIADTLRDFLRRIEDGRVRLKAAKPIIDEFNATKERADVVDRKLNELASLPIPEDEELRRQQADELELLNLEKRSLDKDLSEQWHMYRKATEFIQAFADDINLCAQRLPLTGAWPKFAEAIAGLGIRRIDAWQERTDSRGVNPDLETLELRLQEMLDFASNSPHPAPQVSNGQKATDTAPTKAKRGRRPIPIERKRRAFDEPASVGYTNRERAEILYDTPYPTPQQVRDVTAIRNYYRKTQPAPAQATVS